MKLTPAERDGLKFWAWTVGIAALVGIVSFIHIKHEQWKREKIAERVIEKLKEAR